MRLARHESAADANTEQIEQLFGMNFNREGMAFNSLDSDLYNLTRVQPAPYWSTNHLLLKQGPGTTYAVCAGDKRQADNWERSAERLNFRITVSWSHRLRLRQGRFI